MTANEPPAARARVLGAVAIAFVTFAQVAGSPVGIEDAVHAGGAFGCVLVIILMAFTWAIPQSLITAELATALPVSGGSVVWVEDALGPALGFANTWLVLLNSIFDIPTYSILFANIIAEVWPEAAATLPRTLLCIGVPILSFTLNVLGAEAVAASSEWLTLVVLVPFVAIPFVIAGMHTPLDGRALGPAGVPSPVALSPLVSSVQWNLMGWATIGAWCCMLLLRLIRHSSGRRSVS
jgi:amino acid transporter